MYPVSPPSSSSCAQPERQTDQPQASGLAILGASNSHEQPATGLLDDVMLLHDDFVDSYLSNIPSTPALPFAALSEADITACFSQASTQQVASHSMPAPLAAPTPSTFVAHQPSILTAPMPSIVQQAPTPINTDGNTCVRFIRDIGIKEDAIFSSVKEIQYQEWDRLICLISRDIDKVKNLLISVGWVAGVSGPIAKGTLLRQEPNCYRVLVMACITLIIRNSPHSIISLPTALARISTINEKLKITKDHADLLYHWSTNHLYEPAVTFIHSVNDYHRKFSYKTSETTAQPHH